MTKILVAAETTVRTTRLADPRDKWDAGDTAGEVTNVWAAVEQENDDLHYYGESLIKEFDHDVAPGTTLYAVVADYESGNTFGRSGGHADVLDVFEDAATAARLAEAATASPKSERKYSFQFEGRDYYRSWVGYFEQLQSLDVWEVTVRPTAQSFLTPITDRSYGFKRGT